MLVTMRMALLVVCDVLGCGEEDQSQESEEGKGCYIFDLEEDVTPRSMCINPVGAADHCPFTPTAALVEEGRVGVAE